MLKKATAAPPPICPQHRRGDTLRITCMALDAQGQPCDLSLRDLQSQLRDAQTDELIGNLTIVQGESAGLFYIQAPHQQTEHWPLAQAVFDIQETMHETRTSSDAVSLTITKDITHAV